VRSLRQSRSLTATVGGFDDRASFEESFRILRSNLDVALADMHKPTVIVTSANANEGKTLTCANLAIAFAAAGRRVVLVDLDLRHPNAHRILGGHNEYGASEVLLGKTTAAEAMQYVEIRRPGEGGPGTGLYFLATGVHDSNPAELLGSGRTMRLLESLAGQADLVLIDTPPVLPVADTLVIGRMSSGALLVTEARTTSMPSIQKAKDLLIRNQTRLLGVVLNKFQRRDATYGYGYGYGYGGGRRASEQEEVAAEEPPVSTNGAARIGSAD
jgi:capsular exopolysaccharide synthesis family protein